MQNKNNEKWISPQPSSDMFYVADHKKEINQKLFFTFLLIVVNL